MLFHPLRIASVIRDTEDAIAVTFEVPDDLRGAFAFRAGQYLTLRADIGGAEIRRAYSICSAPSEAGLTVGIKRVEGGVFSSWAHAALRPGSTVEVMAPDGRFGIAPDPRLARHVVGIAAGSGITPILSIIQAVLEGEPGSRCTLLYGSRATAQIMFRTALEDLKDRYLDRLGVVHVLSREAQDIAVLHGRLDEARIAALLPPAPIDEAFICGPEGLIAAAETALAGRVGRVHVERFTPSGPVRAPAPVVPSPARVTATIIFDGKTNNIAVPENAAILDAALAAGLDLPWSCRGGMCSTCRARLTEGAAEMAENFSLEPWETEAGYILTCQARPTTQHVTVDYDQV
jgi:ring-1,2-phenylacetyl-CoA epoxidase subunit PaaE